MVWKRREGIMSSFGPIPKLDREEVQMMIQRPTQPHSSYNLAPTDSTNPTSQIHTPNSENDFSKNHATPKPQNPKTPRGPFIRVWKPLSVSPFVSESNQLNRKGVFCLRTILLLTFG